MDEVVTIRQSKAHNLRFFLGGAAMLLFFLSGLFLDLRPAYGSWGYSLLRIPAIYLFCKGVVLLFVLFLCHTLFLLVKRWKSDEYILRIDRQGITDNSALIQPFGLIPWSHIRRAYIGTIGKGSCIELELFHEEQYLERLHGFRRHTALTNRKHGHQLVCIPLYFTDISPNHLLSVIETRLNESWS